MRTYQLNFDRERNGFGRVREEDQADVFVDQVDAKKVELVTKIKINKIVFWHQHQERSFNTLIMVFIKRGTVDLENKWLLWFCSGSSLNKKYLYFIGLKLLQVKIALLESHRPWAEEPEEIWWNDTDLPHLRCPSLVEIMRFMLECDVQPVLGQISRWLGQKCTLKYVWIWICALCFNTAI